MDISDDRILLAVFLQAHYPDKQRALDKSRALIDRFGGLAGVISAEVPQLAEIVSPRAAGAISITGRISRAAAISRASTAPCLSSPEGAGEYFQPRLANLHVEQVHAAYVNGRNAVITCECVQEGILDQSVVYPRKVLERALFHNASGFILAHNHPSGDTTPSTSDRQLTDLVAAAARPLGVRFLDHIIIGSGQPFSFRSNGLMALVNI